MIFLLFRNPFLDGAAQLDNTLKVTPGTFQLLSVDGPGRFNNWVFDEQLNLSAELD
jgi:hypothetical protein